MSDKIPTGDEEILENTIYQVSTQNRPIRRYVRAVKVYGDKGLVDCEIVLDNDTKQVGKTLSIAVEALVEPDQYPKYRFNPSTWQKKVALSIAEKWAEVDSVLDVYLTSVTASDVVSEESTRRTIDAIKKLLLPIFGGFTLALLLNFLKTKITSVIENRSANTPAPKTYTQKFSEMNRIWSKKAADQVTKFTSDRMKHAAETKKAT